jgi:2-polyprenyl-6-methoxyphenol hydroxylase-like FAD-dependent oxidoreductase
MLLGSAQKNGPADVKQTYDVAVVGAGFAGCLTAIALGRAGHSVVVIEANPTVPNVFRAEKVGGDQLHLLAELGLLDDFKAAATPVRKFINIRGRHIVDIRDVEEYGLHYAEMISLLRARIPENVIFKLGHVDDIVASADVQQIVLGEGETLSARLVVIATGYGKTLLRKLGFESVVVHQQPTICAGFSLQPPPSGFRFPALAAYGERRGDNLDYISIFPMGEVMRGNLFMFTNIRDPRLTALRERGAEGLFELLPGLRSWLHDCGWVGDVSLFPVELSRYENGVRDGIVVVGDAFRTSCPSVGSGLSCALMDVVCLRSLFSDWLQTPGMDATKIATFYNAPRKKLRDESAQRLAFQRRHTVNDTSRAGELRQTAYYFARGMRDRLRRLAS